MKPVVAIVQARMGSTRLPGKTLAPLLGRPALSLMLERIARAEALDGVVVATSVHERDNVIESVALEAGASVYRGSEDDVLERFAEAATEAGAETVVRLTADCPLIPPEVIDTVVRQLTPGDDLVTNAPPAGRTYPDGMDVEAFPRASLERLAASTSDPHHREHVTSGFHTGGWTVRVAHLDPSLGDASVTVDTAQDLARVRTLLEPYAERASQIDLDELLAALAGSRSTSK